MEDNTFYGILVIIAGLFSAILYFLSSSGSTDEGRNAIMIASLSSIVLMLIFGAVTFWYFTANPKYGYPYLLAMNAISLMLAVSALAVSSINVSWK
jgi:hypothetical protein